MPQNIAQRQVNFSSDDIDKNSDEHVGNGNNKNSCCNMEGFLRCIVCLRGISLCCLLRFYVLSLYCLLLRGDFLVLFAARLIRSCIVLWYNTFGIYTIHVPVFVVPMQQ